MQTIFYNANVYTFNKTQPSAEAFLVNDENIVFVGTNSEVLNLKQEETKIVDLQGKTVCPSFFANGISLYKIIEQEIKNAKNDKFLENNDEIDENFYKFDNYELYKEVFLRLQDRLLKDGISTIQEINVSSKEFTFWKRLSEEKLLLLDIVAYIDMINYKIVMDNNCRSYRKYKNHFRIGGYYICIDGKLMQNKAWLNKPYKGEKTYSGYSLILEEYLRILIKNAFTEKKQLMVETNGDKALEFFVYVYEDVLNNEKYDECFRPIALHCTFISKKEILKLKSLNITPSFCISELRDNEKQIKKAIGFFRSKNIFPANLLKKNDIKYLIHAKEDETESLVSLVNNSMSKIKKRKDDSLISVYENFVNNSAYIVFDEEKKGTIESGKLANFIVVNGDLFNEKFPEFPKIEEVYVYGEKR